MSTNKANRTPPRVVRADGAPLVSIICIAYNQEKYVAQAIEGFLMQQTDFSFEVIIHDDASTDGTAAIIGGYVQKYPTIFKPILQSENQYSRTGVAFLGDLYRKTTGKYVCVCEGDDYWTDSQKLQKQVNFLESHPDYAVCFHPVKIVFENGEEADGIFPGETSGFTINKLLRQNYIQTNSVMYRRQAYDHIPTDVMPIDWYMHLYHAQFGKIGFINRVMSVYRRHPGGLWWDQRKKPEQIWVKYGYNFLRLLHEIMLLYGDNAECKKIIENHVAGSYEAISALRPQTVADSIAVKSVGATPFEAWDFIKHLMQQVEHYVELESRLRGRLEEERNTNELLTDELQAIKSSKLWNALLLVRNGYYRTTRPVRLTKGYVGRARTKHHQ